MAAFLVLSGWWSLVMPPYEGYDEPHHLAYVQQVRRTWAIPVLPSPLFQGHQPPAYYYLQAALAEALDLPPPLDLGLRREGDPPLASFHHEPDEPVLNGSPGAIRLQRLVSTLLGAGTLVVAFWTLRSILPGHQSVAIGATATIAVLPQFILVHTLVNNDSLAIFLGALSVYAGVRYWTAEGEDPRLRWVALAGISLGLGVLSKAFVLPLIPLVVGLILLSRFPVRDRIRDGAVVVGLVVVVAGWYVVRNAALYDEPWPLRTARENIALIQPSILSERSITDPSLRGEFFREVRETFWFRGGWAGIRAPDTIHLLLDLFTAVAVIGSVALFANPARSEISSSQRWLLSILVGGLALQLLAVVLDGLHITTPPSGQGRYLFTLLPVIAAFLVLGPAHLAPPRYRRAVHLAIPAAVFAVTLVILLTVYPGYHSGSASA